MGHVIEKSGGVVALDMARTRGSNDVTELYLFPSGSQHYFSLCWLLSLAGLFHMWQRCPWELLAYTALMREIFFPQESI